MNDPRVFNYRREPVAAADIERTVKGDHTVYRYRAPGYLPAERVVMGGSKVPDVLMLIDPKGAKVRWK